MNKKILIFSFTSILATITASDAALRVSNAARNQSNANYNPSYVGMNQNTELPIEIPDAEVRDAFLSSHSTADGIDELNACSMVYPNGEFNWDFPEMGIKKNTEATCVSVVELRTVKGTQDIVLARANLATGDTINCNISDFPAFSYTLDAGNVTFPSDTAPTIEDVTAVMNEEQKQNAGLKIAAGVIIGALGGNAGGSNDVGNTNLLGKDKGKIKGTLVGGLTGGAIMAGNTYAGKVGGDIILSAGVNAAAGGLVGNMTAMNNSALRIENCDIKGSNSKCLWGLLEESRAATTDETLFYNPSSSIGMICKGGANDEKTYDFSNCETNRLNDVVFSGNSKKLSDMSNDDYEALAGTTRYKSSGTTLVLDTNTEAAWYPLASATIPAGSPIPAMIAYDDTKVFGVKMTDWYEWRGKNPNAQMYHRGADGKVGELIVSETLTVAHFHPLSLDSTDGKLIDLGNEARLKNTLVGAGTGAGLGAFTAYQGATDEVTNRWVMATQEYKDSLQKFYCGTGKRFLSSYNDPVIIPNMTTQ